MAGAHSSQSDIDEIQELFNTSILPPVRPAVVESTNSFSSLPPVRPAASAPLAQQPIPSYTPPTVPLLPSGISSSSSFAIPAPSAPPSFSLPADSGYPREPPNYGATAANSTGFGSAHNTLTEPVAVTLRRDLQRVVNNLQTVVLPCNWQEIQDHPDGINHVVTVLGQGGQGGALRDWDLWGPFFFIIILSITLSWTSPTKSAVFGVVFGALSWGALVLTLNVQLLGGKIIFFQSLSVLGYCLFPLDVAAILCAMTDNRFMRTLVIALGMAWSSWSAYPFISGAVPASRRALAVYPVFLLFLAVGALVLANS
eukprot:TRINITY_DN29574_c0_g1_i1.p1 TRINITY_DN29574_c0_g1~~TRINITY_DN29574_c0_g1_i1.p1  ORF type:complete len:312 (-),score=46.12 TRINITY_DN29574_c0_g1_i1:376-1311(-)